MSPTAALGPSESRPIGLQMAEAFWERAGGGDIAAVCCYFNPCGYAARADNYRRFRANIARSGMPLLTVQLAFGDDPFDLPLEEGGLRLRGGDVMWQKERLLRIGGEVLAKAGYRKLVLLDADVLFDDDAWPERVSRALDTLPLMQCFSVAEHRYSDTSSVQPAIVVAPRGTIADDAAAGHAWAIRSEVFLGAGLFECCVVGGGDVALGYAALGLTDGHDSWDTLVRRVPFLRETGTAMQESYRAWARTLTRVTGGACGCVEGRVVSLPHGAKRDRCYVTRHRLLSGFRSDEELMLHDCGAFAWTDAGAHRRAAVAEYFRHRDEDPSRGVASHGAHRAGEPGSALSDAPPPRSASTDTDGDNGQDRDG